MITTEMIASVIPGWQEVTVPTAGTTFTVRGPLVPEFLLWLPIDTSNPGAAVLTYDRTNSTSVDGIATCQVFSNVDNQVYRVVPVYGKEAVNV